MTGNTLRRMREELGLSQAELGALAGLSGRYRRQTVQRIEAGRYPLTEAFEEKVLRGIQKLQARRARIEEGLAKCDSLVESIRYLKRMREPDVKIAERFRVSRQYVGEVLRKVATR